MWCLADTFEQEIRFGKGAEELEDFYREYSQSIWLEKIEKEMAYSSEMKSWSDLVATLLALCDYSQFKLI